VVASFPSGSPSVFEVVLRTVVLRVVVVGQRGSLDPGLQVGGGASVKGCGQRGSLLPGTQTSGALVGHLGSLVPGVQSTGSSQSMLPGAQGVVGHRGSLFPGKQTIGPGVVMMLGGGHSESLESGLQDRGVVANLGQLGSVEPGRQTNDFGVDE